MFCTLFMYNRRADMSSSLSCVYVTVLLATSFIIIFCTPAECIPNNKGLDNISAIQTLKSILTLPAQLSNTTHKFRCTSTSECKPNHTCMNALIQPCDPNSNGATSQCICFPSANNQYRCASTSDCKNGKVCAGLPISSTGFCLSCDVFYASTGLVIIGGNNCVFQSNACIDASLLSTLPLRHLVFAKHLRTYVLCDQHGSCATPGHVVVVNRLPMMMRTYCRQLAKCRRRIALVNSPRVKRALRVRSKTDGLAFTSFAAQYETSLEELVLSTIIRMGM